MCALKVFHADLPAHYHTNFNVTIKIFIGYRKFLSFFFLRSSLSFYFFIFFPVRHSLWRSKNAQFARIFAAIDQTQLLNLIKHVVE